MHKFYTPLFDLIFKPFYHILIVFPFTLKSGKYAVYKQIQYIHFKLTKKQRKASIIKDITPLKNCVYKMILEPGQDFHQFHLAIAGFYEKSITKKICLELLTADVFIDVGAYLGYYSILAASLSPKLEVYAFEPQKEAYKKLKRNLLLNNSTINAYNYALGSKNETKDFYIDIFPERSSLIKAKQKDEAYEIEINKADDLFDFKNKNIVIKIDTEGYEFEVLKGMEKLLTQNNCTVFFEYNPLTYKTLYGEGFSEILSIFFNDIHYKFYKISEKSKTLAYTFKHINLCQENLMAKK